MVVNMQKGPQMHCICPGPVTFRWKLLMMIIAWRIIVYQWGFVERKRRALLSCFTFNGSDLRKRQSMTKSLHIILLLHLNFLFHTIVIICMDAKKNRNLVSSGLLPTDEFRQGVVDTSQKNDFSCSAWCSFLLRRIIEVTNNLFISHQDTASTIKL